MLTSSANQYLRPEYLTPLPTTLDAKKSPLALLAQTCSQIGADSPPSKPLIPPLEKPSKSSSSSSSSGSKADTPREKASPASSAGSDKAPSAPAPASSAAFKPYEATPVRDKAATPEERGGGSAGSRSRTPAKGAATPGGRCASAASGASPRASPAAAAGAGRKSPASVGGTPLPAADAAPAAKERASPPPKSVASSMPGFGASLLADATLKDVPLGTYKPGAYLGYPAHFPADLGLLAPQHLKPGGGLSPYMSYARMKSAAGTDTLVPVCRDPYCSGCQLNSHLLASSGAAAAAAAAAAVAAAAGKGGAAAAGACPGGCAQCEHAGKAAAAAAAASGSSGFLPAGAGHSSAAAAAYAHAQLAALAAASHLPYVCNWIAGDAAYCGKRFASSEELLQHLRTHTSDSLLGAAAAAAAAGASAPPPPPHPLLHRTYPTPPLSPLATARYHPYSKPPALLPPSLGFPLHAHPGLPPYFSPYALYGQRLGAAAAAAAASSMHP